MLPSVLVAIGCLAVSAAGYDFSDEVFNQYLSSQLVEWSEKDRIRRSPTDEDKNDDNGNDNTDNNENDENKNSSCRPPHPPHHPPPHRPHHHHWKSCCGNGKWMKNFGGNDGSSVEQCMNEFKENLNTTGKDDHEGMHPMEDQFSCAKVNMKKMQAVCMSECVGKKSGLLTAEGRLKSQNIRTYILNDLIQEDWSKVIAEGAVDKCIQISNSTAMKTTDTGDMKCNPEMLSFMHCLWLHIEKNCPEYQRKQDPKCMMFFQRLETNRKSGNVSHV